MKDIEKRLEALESHMLEVEDWIVEFQAEYMQEIEIQFVPDFDKDNLN